MQSHDDPGDSLGNPAFPSRSSVFTLRAAVVDHQLSTKPRHAEQSGRVLPTGEWDDLSL